ncbi:MAG TPA: PLD nuclease N-terminal domain-containing protein [Tepidisphaeraceae bacterium]|nr:PLD nuclease N-terminal domain-containing protein [Tepidisphaeraceae bacterium]
MAIWIIAIVDVVRRRFPDSTVKLIWVLVVLLAHVFGAVIYLIIGRRQGTLSRT